MEDKTKKLKEVIFNQQDIIERQKSLIDSLFEFNRKILRVFRWWNIYGISVVVTLIIMNLILRILGI
jgi:hypothetical protein